MMKTIFIVAMLSIMVTTNAFAAAPITDVSILQIITAAMQPAINKLLSQAIFWLSAFAAIQFVVNNINLIKSGADFEAIWAKLLASVLWLTFCMYVLANGPAFIGSVGNEFFNMVGIGLPSPGAIMAATTATTAILAGVATGVGLISNTGGQLVLYVLLFIFSVGMLFALKIFMLQLELGLIVMISPLSFSFLGLNAFKEQGIAPFKALVSLGYRILLMTIILSAFTKINDVVITTIKSLSVSSFTNMGLVAETIFSGLTAYVVLAYLLWKSDSIAASLASGSSNMGTADVAGAAAAGAAAGALMASGAGAATGLVTKPYVAANAALSGGGGIKDESRTGLGGKDPIGEAPQRPPSPSLASHPVRPSPTPPAGSPGAIMSTAADRATGGALSENQRNAGVNSFAGGGSITDASQAMMKAGASQENAKAGAVAMQSSAEATKLPDAPSMYESKRPGGDGSSAGISGSSGGSESEKKLEKLVDPLSQTKKPTFSEHLARTNDHLSKESATTQVSINVNAE